jgi:hypothetical protein
MAKRAKGTQKLGPKKGSAPKNDNTKTLQGNRRTLRTLSSEDSKYVGRPGFRGLVPGPVDGKAGIRRVRQVDPARGITQPGADVITTANVDLVGAQNPGIESQALTAAPSQGKKVVRPPRSSAPVESNKPGRVVRPGKGVV